MLRAYIESTVELAATHRSRMTVLLELVLSGAFPYEPATDVQTVGHVEAILRTGQANGEFRDFDPAVVATAVQRAVEGLPFILQARPDLDCTTCQPRGGVGAYRLPGARRRLLRATCR